MKQKQFFPAIHFLILILAIVFIQACTPQKPNTPQTVAEAFWSASLKGDTETAKQLLTPQSSPNFKIILHDQKDFVELGEQNITISKAIILTQLTRHKGKKQSKTALRTILINQNGQWLVDFDQTRDSMLGSELQSVIDSLSNTMRETIDKGVQVMGESVKDELQKMEHSLQDALEDLNHEIDKQQQQNRSSQQQPKTRTL